jgi:hypothetical protein
VNKKMNKKNSIKMILRMKVVLNKRKMNEVKRGKNKVTRYE